MSVIDVVTARTFLMQFTISNAKYLPHVRYMGESKPQYRRKGANGEKLIKETENVDVKTLLSPLLDAGYELVDAYYTAEKDKRDRTKEFYIVPFYFCRSEYAVVETEVASCRDRILSDLREMCTEALWITRGYKNPLIVKDELIRGEHAISLNFTKRNPLYDGNDKPVLQWRKDPRGRKIGDAPVPIRPDHYLDFSDNEVRLLPSS